MKQKFEQGVITLANHGEVHQDDSESQRIADAIAIFSQMTQTLEDNRKQGNAVLINNNSRWLINKDGRVSLSSDAPVGEHSAPDKMHAQALGKNLYQYLTNCKTSDLNWPYDFNSSIFKSSEGNRIHAIIRDLVHPTNPACTRVQEVLERLEQINSVIKTKEERLNTLKEHYKAPLEEMSKAGVINQDKFNYYSTMIDKCMALDDFVQIEKDISTLKKTSLLPHQHQCEDVLTKIAKFGFGEKDEMMKDYIQEQKKKIASATCPQELAVIKDELNSKLKELDNPATKEIRNIIESFHNNASLWTIGMKAKAQRIEEAMSKVPLAERGNILNGDSKEIKQVRLEMASHRHLHRDTYYKTKNDDVDEAKAASSFTQFKQRLSAAKDEIKKSVTIANSDKENTTQYDEYDTPYVPYSPGR